MHYSIVFSDIDGTLVPFGENHPSPRTVQALQRLQDKGIKLVVATGRGPAHITADFLGGIVPDYTIAFNGAYIMDGAGSKLFDSPMNEAQFEAIEKLGRQGHAVGYSFIDGYYVYHNADKLVTLSGATLKKGKGLKFNLRTDRHLESMPYVSFCNYPDEEVERFNRENPSLKLV